MGRARGEGGGKGSCTEKIKVRVGPLWRRLAAEREQWEAGEATVCQQDKLAGRKNERISDFQGRSESMGELKVAVWRQKRRLASGRKQWEGQQRAGNSGTRVGGKENL